MRTVVLECDTYCIHPQPKGKPALCNRSLGSSESHLESAHWYVAVWQRSAKRDAINRCSWIFHALTEVNDAVGIQDDGKITSTRLRSKKSVGVIPVQQI